MKSNFIIIHRYNIIRRNYVRNVTQNLISFSHFVITYSIYVVEFTRIAVTVFSDINRRVVVFVLQPEKQTSKTIRCDLLAKQLFDYLSINSCAVLLIIMFSGITYNHEAWLRDQLLSTCVMMCAS